MEVGLRLFGIADELVQLAPETKDEFRLLLRIENAQFDRTLQPLDGHFVFLAPDVDAVQKLSLIHI